MIVTPVLILMIMLAVQAAIYFHAANVATAAAAEGAAVMSRRDAGAADGVAAANALVAELGATAAAPTRVAEDPMSVTVTVEIAVPSVVPFFPDSVSRTAVEPNERFVPEGDR